MKTIEQIRNGAMVYLIKEIVPMLGTGKALALEAFAPTIIEANIKQYIEKEWIACTNFVDGEKVNVEVLYRLLKGSSTNKWPITLFGIRFNETDLDKMYECIKEV